MARDETRRRFVEASALLASVRDIVDERPEGASVPSWCARRGWGAFLASLPDDVVLAAERDGLAAVAPSIAHAPGDLVALAREVSYVTALPAAPCSPSGEVDPRRASPRKRAQVAAFAALAAGLARGAARVVDVGAGHGHLTRHLARALGVAAEGWERDPARVAVASSLAVDAGARFVAVDARDPAAALSRSDLVVALHACGELGDHAARAASAAGASLALVGCCLQKREGDRAPLVVPPGMTRASLTIGRAALGLGNARDGDEGVEADLAARTASRVNRDALRVALGDAGVALSPGEEMRGVNRRRAVGAFEDLVAHAFALRGVAPPSRAAVERARRAALDAYALGRRHALPRAMLARLVEVWVALDRAALLASRGYEVEAVVAFDASVSPRNVAVLGHSPAASSPPSSVTTAM